ncbi:MAG: hypothetical protein HYS23_07670 [Geobacter sp.]|nr:hypothetical protein [Geobacter sp.]
MVRQVFVTVIVLFLSVSITSLIFSPPAHAEKIPALSEIPATVPDNTRQQLSRRWQELEIEMASFLAEAKVFNAKKAEDQSDAEYNALNQRRDAYITAAKAFNKTVDFAKILNDTNRSVPIDATITNDKNKRTAYHYHRVIEQFKLSEMPKRYKVETFDENEKKKIRTFCNIFVWDVTRAMVGPVDEIPHWVLGEEMNVNKLVDWLKKEGGAKGWRRLDHRGAQQAADDGHPTVAIWKNTKGHGHVAIVRPGSVGDERGAAIAQAGRWVLDATHLTKGFNDPRLRKDIEFWTHD